MERPQRPTAAKAESSGLSTLPVTKAAVGRRCSSDQLPQKAPRRIRGERGIVVAPRTFPQFSRIEARTRRSVAVESLAPPDTEQLR